MRDGGAVARGQAAEGEHAAAKDVPLPRSARVALDGAPISTTGGGCAPAHRPARRIGDGGVVRDGGAVACVQAAVGEHVATTDAAALGARRAALDGAPDQLDLGGGLCVQPAALRLARGGDGGIGDGGAVACVQAAQGDTPPPKTGCSPRSAPCCPRWRSRSARPPRSWNLRPARRLVLRPRRRRRCCARWRCRRLRSGGRVSTPPPKCRRSPRSAPCCLDGAPDQLDHRSGLCVQPAAPRFARGGDGGVVRGWRCRRAVRRPG